MKNPIVMSALRKGLHPWAQIWRTHLQYHWTKSDFQSARDMWRSLIGVGLDLRCLHLHIGHLCNCQREMRCRTSEPTTVGSILDHSVVERQIRVSRRSIQRRSRNIQSGPAPVGMSPLGIYHRIVPPGVSSDQQGRCNMLAFPIARRDNLSILQDYLGNHLSRN